MGRMNSLHFSNMSSTTEDDRLQTITDGLIVTLTGALIKSAR